MQCSQPLAAARLAVADRYRSGLNTLYEETTHEKSERNEIPKIQFSWGICSLSRTYESKDPQVRH